MELRLKVVNVLPQSSYVSKRDGSTVSTFGFVGETLDSQYPKRVKVDVFGEERWGLMAVRVGGVYDVSLDASSREYNGKWYTSLTAWKVLEVQQVQAQPQVVSQQYAGYPVQQQVSVQGSSYSNPPY